MSTAENKLLKAIAQGDKAAMRDLYERYQPRLGRFLQRVTQDPELIQEAINDVMLTVWRSSAGFRGDSAVSTWVLGIAYRKALDLLRSQRRYNDLVNSLPEPAPVDDASGAAMQRDLNRMLALLTPEQRAVAELSFDFGYSYPEIAEILGIPANTVKTRMFYARQTMQAWYDRASEGKL